MLTAIKNGQVYDGAGNAPVQKNILIRDDRIVSIDSSPVREADVIIDAIGSIVMPGFINVGSRADKTFSILSDKFQESAITQGITTQILGSEGISFAPFYKGIIDEFDAYANIEDIAHNWRDIGDFLNFLTKRGVGTNIGTLVGLSNVRGMFIKSGACDLTEGELKFSLKILRESFSSGALGFSASYTEGDGCVDGAPHSEVNALVSLASDMGRVCAFRMPSQDLKVAFGDLLWHAKVENMNMELSFARPFQDSPDAYEELSAFMEQLSSKGYIHFDVFPFPEPIISAKSLLPSWARGVNPTAVLETIFSQGAYEELCKYFKIHKDSDISIWRVADKSLKFLEGKSVREFSKNRGRSYERGLLELFKLTKLRVLFKNPEGELAVRKFVTHPRAIASWPETESFGPMNFLKLAETEKLVTVESAIEKMTSLPAKKYGISKRGVIAQGNYADVVIARDFKVKEVLINGSRVIESRGKNLSGKIILPEQKQI